MEKPNPVDGLILEYLSRVGEVCDELRQCATASPSLKAKSELLAADAIILSEEISRRVGLPPMPRANQAEELAKAALEADEYSRRIIEDREKRAKHQSPDAQAEMAKRLGRGPGVTTAAVS